MEYDTTQYKYFDIPESNVEEQTLELQLKQATDQWKEKTIHDTIPIGEFTFTFEESPERHESLVSVEYNDDETRSHGFSYDVFKYRDVDKIAHTDALKDNIKSLSDVSSKKANDVIKQAFNEFMDRHRDIIETKILLHRKCVDINKKIYLQAEKNKYGDERTEFEGIPVPPEYSILGHGLFKIIKSKDGHDIPVPIACACAITGIGVDDKGNPAVCLAWETDDGKVKQEYYPKWMIQDKSGLAIIRKCDGFSFTDNNTSDVMKYLDTLINDEKKRPENESKMTHFAYTDRTGWHDGGFVYGNGTVGPKDYAIINPKSEYIPHLTTSGTIEGWVKGVSPLLQDKYTLFVFWGGLMSPLLSIFALRSIILNQSGGTGVSKTTAILLLLSAIGHPEKLMFNGNTTPNAHEPYLASQRDMPTSMDETTILDDAIKKVIKYIIYMGKGKSRLGDWDYYTWLTVLLTTMETSIFSEDSEDGEIVRVINMNRTKETRPPQADIDAFYDHVYPSEFDEKNYGHFIEPYITLIVEKHKTGELKALFKQYKAQFRSEDKTQDRMSGHFAAICVSGCLCNEIFRQINIPVAYNDPYLLVREMADNYFATTPEPKHIRALTDLLSEIDVNIMYMDNPRYQGGGQYSEGVRNTRKIQGYEAGNYGKSVKNDNEHLLSLSFTKTALKKFGWKWNDIKDIWKREGIIVTAKEGHTITRPVKDPDGNIKDSRCVILNLKVIQKVTDIDMKGKIQIPEMYRLKNLPFGDNRKPVYPSLQPIMKKEEVKETGDDMYIPFLDENCPEKDEVLTPMDPTKQVIYPTLPVLQKFKMN